MGAIGGVVGLCSHEDGGAETLLVGRAALPAGVSRAGNTLTFADTFVGTTFTFGLTAQNDQLVEGTEALALTLTNATIANGTTGITTATASTDITEIDQNVTFALSRDVASISEEAPGTVNFTITLSQALVAGNSVTVDIADVVNTQYLRCFYLFEKEDMKPHQKTTGSNIGR